jgi:hypothetical protein
LQSLTWHAVDIVGVTELVMLLMVTPGGAEDDEEEGGPKKASKGGKAKSSKKTAAELKEAAKRAKHASWSYRMRKKLFGW